MSDNPNNPYPQGNPYNPQGNPSNPYPQGNPYGSQSGGPARYCPVCGTGLVAQAVICPSCGSPTGQSSFGGKSKTAGVLLAVFLGPWTWLYTY